MQSFISLLLSQKLILAISGEIGCMWVREKAKKMRVMTKQLLCDAIDTLSHVQLITETLCGQYNSPSSRKHLSSVDSGGYEGKLSRLFYAMLCTTVEHNNMHACVSRC